MRLANGIVLDKDTTFGELKFSALRREVRIQNEDGSVSDEINQTQVVKDILDHAKLTDRHKQILKQQSVKEQDVITTKK